MSDAIKGENHPNFGKHHSDETIRKISEATKGEKHHNYGKPRSKETIRKMSEAQKGKPQRKIQCPHCKMMGSIGNMTRWHFENCKFKQ